MVRITHYRYFAKSRLLAFCGIVILCATPKFVRHFYTEYRCAEEAMRTRNNTQFIAEGKLKQDMVQEFIQVYDFELNGCIHADAHLLPERLTTCRQVHPDNSAREIGAVLQWLTTARIERVYVDEYGNSHPNSWTGRSLKLFFDLEGGAKAIFKMKRRTGMQEITSDIRRLKSGIERHTSEIAAYHLQRYIGHINIMYSSIFLYAVRFVMYGAITNPWWVLPAEILQGVTFSCIWVSLTAYSAMSIPSTSLATMQGILHGVYFGLGNGTGHLIGGIVIGYVGAPLTFYCMAAACLIVLALFFVAQQLGTKPDLSYQKFVDDS